LAKENKMISLIALAVVTTTPFTPTPSTHSYMYFDEAIPLSIDYSMVAIYDEDGVPEIPSFVIHHDSSFTLSSVDGWAYVKTPSEIIDDKQFDRFLRSMQKSGLYDLVTPIFFGEGELPYIPTRDLLVKMNAFQNQGDAESELSKHGVILDNDFAGIQHLYRIRTEILDGRDVLELANLLARMDMFEYAESDAIAWTRTLHMPNDPEFSAQWGLHQSNNHDMDLPEAWDISFGSEDIVVVVLDSGIDQSHPDIHQLTGETFTGSSSNGEPSNMCDNHGTAVAGCVAATIDNNIGVVGVAPHCFVRAGKVFNEVSLFDLICLPFLEFQDSWVVSGITWASSSGASITNSSWGGGTPSSSITNAFNQTRDDGLLHIAAAGNDGTSTIGWPANLNSVVAVAAMSSNGTLASFSTFGNGLFISAPGEGIRTTDRSGSDGYDGGDTTTISGTSFASPYTAGVAALIRSVDSSLTPQEVEDVMASTAVDYGPVGYDTTFGHGFVNAGAALASLDNPTCEADINGDSIVGVTDLLVIIDQWLTNDVDADINGDGIVNVNDLLMVVGNWGPCL